MIKLCENAVTNNSEQRYIHDFFQKQNKAILNINRFFKQLDRIVGDVSVRQKNRDSESLVIK